MKSCPKTLRGHHKFEARYSEKVPDACIPLDPFWTTPRQIEAIKTKIYVRDVCVRCGLTIERAKP